MNHILIAPYQHQDFFKVFQALDINGDRMLDINEFKVGYSKYYGIRIEDSELEKLFNASTYTAAVKSTSLSSLYEQYGNESTYA